MSGPTRTLALTLAAALLPILAAPAADDEAARTKEGLDAFQAYLKKEHPDKKWQQEPTRLDSAALRTAYGNQRLYVVYSSPPLPPGANIKSVQEAYRRQVEDIRTNHVSLAVRVDEKGQVMPLVKPQDYNVGLMKIAGDEDARTAAAAILSLHRCDHVAPAAVDPKDVRRHQERQGLVVPQQRQGLLHGHGDLRRRRPIHRRFQILLRAVSTVMRPCKVASTVSDDRRQQDEGGVRASRLVRAADHSVPMPVDADRSQLDRPFVIVGQGDLLVADRPSEHGRLCRRRARGSSRSPKTASRSSRGRTSGTVHDGDPVVCGN